MNTSESAKKAKLAAQWPKLHKCKDGEVLFTEKDWKRLPHPKVTTKTDPYCTLEFRDCKCGSTLAVMIKIHDLSEE